MANATLSPEEQLPDEQTTGPDPLEQLGYNEATTPAERTLEIEQAEQPSQADQAKEELKERVKDEIKDEAKSRWTQFRERFRNSQKKLKGEPAAGEEAAGETVANEAGEVAGQAAKTGLRGVAGEAGATAGAEAAAGAAAAGVEGAAVAGAAAGAETAAVAAGAEAGGAALVAVGWPVIIAVLIILVIIIVFVVIAVGHSLSSKTSGGGPPVYPSTPVQQEQATLLASLSGDAIANNKTVAEVIKDEKARYDRLKANAKKYSAGDVAAIDQKITEFTPLLDSLLSVADKAGKRAIQKDLIAKMSAFENTLPFGDWISKIALGHQSEGSLNFCKITKAGSNAACASFASTVLWEAGVPNAIVSVTTAIWNNTYLRTVVDRPVTRSGDTWKNNKDKLKPGDIVWWGDGSCSSVRYAGKLFDHVGIYVGNGEAVDNSSAKDKILKRNAASRGSCLVFNGAKRYGKE